MTSNEKTAFKTEKAPQNCDAEKLTPAERLRYSRHLVLPQIGEKGQIKLKKSRVLIVGAGGLGSPLGLYLAAAGVGLIGLVDADKVDESNLQRQIIHSITSVGQPKVFSAKDRLFSLNPNVHIKAFETRLNPKNALELIGGFDVIADAADNFQTRYLINDACVLLKKPFVHGAVLGFEGRAGVFAAPKGPCYRCLYPEPPPPGFSPTGAEGGIIGVLPGIIGSIQAAEVVKLLLGAEEGLIGRLLTLEGWKMAFRELVIQKNPQCPACGETPTVTDLIDYDRLCGYNLEEIERVPSINAPELQKLLSEKNDSVRLVDIREPGEQVMGYLLNSVFLPYPRLLAELADGGPGSITVLICRNGHKSGLATQALIKAGFTGNFLKLNGGLNEWSRLIGHSITAY